VRIALVLLMIGASGCRSLSLRGDQVRVTTHDSDVTDCRFLGEVKAHAPFVGPNDAENTVRNNAAGLGADVVRISYGFGVATGRAFDCGGRYAKR